MLRLRPALHRRGAGAFTLIELLVVIAIIMLLAAIALPVLQQVTRQARAANCVSNLKQLAVAFNSYATANDGLLTGTEACHTPTWLFHCDPDHGPGTTRPAGWDRVPTGGQLYPHFRDPGLILCPSDSDGNGKFSYSVPVINRYRLLDGVPNATKTLLIAEEHPNYNIGGHGNPARREGGFACSDRPSVRHSGKTTTGWFDGHAELIEYPAGTTARDFNREIWTQINSNAWRENCGQDYRPPGM